MSVPRFVVLLFLGFALCGRMYARADDGRALAESLRRLSPEVLEGPRREAAGGMVRQDLRTRLRSANDRSREAWGKIENREQWEAFRDPRVEALRRSLGEFPDPPDDLNVRVTGKIAGDGFRIENLLFESRPGLWLTANLYLPTDPGEAMPGVLICHSHHRPKTHGELQDMGMTWARGGCAALVMDQLGHGERRQHPFAGADDYDGEFAVSRQDYYFRFDTGIQLHLVGESLVGWMAWDLMRGVDLLLARGDVDSEKIVLLGAVAGGGDPAAVAAALDERIDVAVPFNFGGPQPETRYPLPEDAEETFNYAGGGSWESTRNLRLSARDGFLPWVIVAGVAPRKLIFAHEFNWHRERDPVWKRLRAVYAFYEAGDSLAYTHGRGELRGRPPEATHCTHIGRPHRVMIHQALNRWLGVPVTPEDEYSNRLDESELLCLTPEARREVEPRELHELLTDLAQTRMSSARKRRQGKSAAERREILRSQWADVLGPIDPASPPDIAPSETEVLAGAEIHRVTLTVEPGIFVPLLLLAPTDAEKAPVVVGLAQGGKAGFLENRSTEIAQLLTGGAIVCLPDLRGVGETSGGEGRGRYSAATGRSSTELMLGGTTVGARLRDLRSVLAYLRERDDADGKRIALWGDSFAPTNPPERNFRVPRRIDGRPQESEPLGGMLALLGGLFDEQVAAVAVHGGLASLASVLDDQFVYLPHDAVVPGALTAGDLDDVAAVLAPRPLRIGSLVDGFNRRLPSDETRKSYALTQAMYRPAASRLTFGENDDIAAWLLKALGRP